MITIWEMDFYSRPLVDENGKKVWELLLCESGSNNTESIDDLFKFSLECPSNQVNSLWLANALQEAMSKSEQTPQKIRFFRRQMNNMITKACMDVGIPASPSRRTIALYQWLNDRSVNFYPHQPNYQGSNNPSVQMPLDPPQRLPDALSGEKWSMVSLTASQMAEMGEWSIAFGDAFSPNLVGLSPDTIIPGLIIYSNRAIPLAAWLSGLELASVRNSVSPQSQLILDTGASDSWILSSINQNTQASVTQFELQKAKAKGVHFIAVQTNAQAEEFAGFWLLQEIVMNN